MAIMLRTYAFNVIYHDKLQTDWLQSPLDNSILYVRNWLLPYIQS